MNEVERDEADIRKDCHTRYSVPDFQSWVDVVSRLASDVPALLVRVREATEELDQARRGLEMCDAEIAGLRARILAAAGVPEPDDEWGSEPGTTSVEWGVQYPAGEMVYDDQADAEEWQQWLVQPNRVVHRTVTRGPWQPPVPTQPTQGDTP